LKKSKQVLLFLSVLTLILTGCSSKSAGFDSTKAISVISREDGSGTRGAFIELFGVEQKDSSGKKVDYTTDSAIISNSTSVVMGNVAENEYAIGYISLGSLNDTVKALKVDGADATVENIKSGTYKIARPFNIATKAEISELAQDFINYILSDAGQAVIEENGYISINATTDYVSSQVTGQIVVGGSSSVTPVMEKLKEAYMLVNPNASIEVQQSDSTTGMTSTIDGIYDIGMASRELKESELSAGLINYVIAMDGIAVVVNNVNPLENITSEQVKAIYMGETTGWAELINS